MASRKRVSYSLAPPRTPPPALGLPPPANDAALRPSLSYRTFPPQQQQQQPHGDAHPTHCRGVTALALDTTTILRGHDAPRGILYTGGRDGLVASWEQGVPLVPAAAAAATEGDVRQAGDSEPVRWERIGMTDDDDEDDEDGDEEYAFDAAASAERRGVSGGDTVPRRNVRNDASSTKWTVDKEAIQRDGALGQPTFRQSLQAHTDWVNDLVIVNQGRTVLTASSDRSIRAWQPHSQETHDQPALVGVHNDYVKCLAFAAQPSLLFSGGLDAQINVWDIHSPKPYAPIMSIATGGDQDTGGAVGGGVDKGSVYALVTNPQGTLLASGTPERIIRLWDPRVGASAAAGGKSNAGQLVGHTDNVKALLMSEDGRYMLSGSSDSTVKLWSLAAQRCIHTFTHHTHPIWSLASSHPNLERFFSGDRAGHLCVTDLSGIATDWGEGECTLVAKCEKKRGEREGTQGIVRIECMMDELVWTATASADVARWRDVGAGSTRGNRAAFGSLRNGFDAAQRQPESGTTTTTTTSAAAAPTSSILGSQNPFLTAETKDARAVAFAPSPLGTTTTTTGAEHAGEAVPLTPAGIPYACMISLGAPSDSVGGGPYPSLARGSLSHGPSLYTASAVSLPRDTTTAVAASDTKSGQQGHARVPSHASLFPFPRNAGAQAATLRDPAEVARIQFDNRDVASEATPLRSLPDAVIRGRPGLIRAKVLNDRQHVLTLDTAGKVSIWNIVKGICLGTFRDEEVESVFQANHGLVHGSDGEVDSKEALDLIAEHVDGQSFVRQWCEVDTRNGNITVHLEEATCWEGEVYADQVGYADDPEFRPDDRINLGKWVLANLFAGLIKVEAAEAAKHEQQSQLLDSNSASAANAAEPSLQRGSAPTYIALDRATGPATRQRLRSQSSASGSGSMTPGGLLVGLATPAATPAIVHAGPPQESTGPDLDAWANRGRTNGHHLGNMLSPIPQSPALSSNYNSPTPMAFSPSAAKSPRGDPSNGKDYFSFPSKKSRGTTPGSIVTKDPSPTPRPDSAALVTPGGSQASFMGKFKGFGGKSRKPSDVAATPNGSNAVLPANDDAPTPQAVKSDDKGAEHLRSLDEIRSQPFNPPFYSEAPPFDFPENTAVIISETAQNAGAWAVTYRSMVSKVERNPEALEMAAPAWLLDFLFTGRTKTLEPKKLTFILEPWPDAEEMDKLPPLPPSTCRLSAVQTVRVGKIIAYVCPRIDLSVVSRRGSVASVSSGRIRPVTVPAKVEGSEADPMTPAPLSARSPGKFMAVEQAAIAAAEAARKGQDSAQEGDVLYSSDTLEILCNGVVVPLNMTLAAVKQFIWNNPGVHGPRGPGLNLPSAADVVLHYRLKKNGL